MMQQRRLEKINELVHRFVARLLREELDVDALVTVSSVTTSANGQNSAVSVTVFPFEKSAVVLRELGKNIYQFQQKLNRGLNMRPVPKIRFKINESEEKGNEVLRVIDNLG